VTKDVFEETKGTQRPWQNWSLDSDFYFLPPPVIATAKSLKLGNGLTPPPAG